MTKFATDMTTVKQNANLSWPDGQVLINSILIAVVQMD